MKSTKGKKIKADTKEFISAEGLILTELFPRMFDIGSQGFKSYLNFLFKDACQKNTIQDLITFYEYIVKINIKIVSGLPETIVIERMKQEVEQLVIYTQRNKTSEKDPYGEGLCNEIPIISDKIKNDFKNYLVEREKIIQSETISKNKLPTENLIRNAKKNKVINLNLKLPDAFSEISKYNSVMTELVKNQYCSEHSYKWIFKEKGYKTLICAFLHTLYTKKYYSRLFTDKELKLIALNTFEIDITVRTFQNNTRIQELSQKFSFIKFSSTTS